MLRVTGYKQFELKHRILKMKLAGEIIPLFSRIFVTSLLCLFPISQLVESTSSILGLKVPQVKRIPPFKMHHRFRRTDSQPCHTRLRDEKDSLPRSTKWSLEEYTGFLGYKAVFVSDLQAPIIKSSQRYKIFLRPQI